MHIFNYRTDYIKKNIIIEIEGEQNKWIEAYVELDFKDDDVLYVFYIGVLCQSNFERQADEIILVKHAFDANDEEFEFDKSAKFLKDCKLGLTLDYISQYVVEKSTKAYQKMLDKVQ